jgi:hypothetical protein
MLHSTPTDRPIEQHNGGVMAKAGMKHSVGLWARYGDLIRFTISALVLGSLAFFVDWRSLGEAARSVSWHVIGLCSAVLLLQVLIGAWRANLFLRIAGSRPDAAFVVQAYALSVVANTLLLNFVAGAIARIVLLQRQQVAVSLSVAAIFAEKLIILVTLGGLGVVAAYVWIETVNHEPPSLRDALVVFGVGTLMIVAGAFSVLAWGHFFVSLLRGWSRVTADQFLALISGGKTWLMGIGATLLSLLCAWAAYVLLARAVGISNAAPIIALVVPLVSLVASLPISLGGWGVRELSFSVLLLGFGVAPEKAVLVTGIASLLALVAAVVVAMAIFGWKRRAL